jgi:hypothetical protein
LFFSSLILPIVIWDMGRESLAIWWERLSTMKRFFTIRLRVLDGNDKTFRFWQKMGYSATGERKLPFEIFSGFGEKNPP